MAQRVVWSPRAIADVDAIASYIASDSPSYASAVVRRIVTLVRTLAEFPLAGRMVPEFDDENIRDLVQQNEVIVAAVIHGRRML